MPVTDTVPELFICGRLWVEKLRPNELGPIPVRSTETTRDGTANRLLRFSQERAESHGHWFGVEVDALYGDLEQDVIVAHGARTEGVDFDELRRVFDGEVAELLAEGLIAYEAGTTVIVPTPKLVKLRCGNTS